MMTKMLNRAREALNTPMAVRVFGLVSFLESAILPIPVESIFLPLMVARRKEGWKLALIGSVTSVAGGVVGYLIGLLLFETVGRFLLELYQFTGQFEEIRADMASAPQRGAIMIFLGAVSPIPYKVVCIAAGALAYNFLLFVLISAVGRSMRYFAYAVAFALFGDSISRLIAQRPRLVSALVIGTLIAGFLALYVTW